MLVVKKESKSKIGNSQTVYPRRCSKNHLLYIDPTLIQKPKPNDDAMVTVQKRIFHGEKSCY